MAFRDTGDPEARPTLVEAARLAEARRRRPHRAEILGDLDAESLWAGLRLEPARPPGRRRGRTRPVPDPLSRSGPDAADDGARRRADLRRQRPLEPPCSPRPDATADGLDDAVLSARILLRWFWSVSGPSGLAARASIGDELIALDDVGVFPAAAAAAGPPRAGVVRPRARRRRLARRCVDDARALAHPVRTPTGWAHLQFAEAGLAILDGDLDRARGHADALRTALHGSAATPPTAARPASSPSSRPRPATPTRRWPSSPSCWRRRTPTPISWLEAWVLAEAGRIDEARSRAGRVRRAAPRRLAAPPAHHGGGQRRRGRVGDERFLRRHLPDARTVRRPVRVRRRGRLHASDRPPGAGRRRSRARRRAAARVHAEQAVAIAERMGAVLWLPRAKRLLADLSSRRRAFSNRSPTARGGCSAHGNTT